MRYLPPALLSLGILTAAAQPPSLWTADYDLAHPLTRAEDYRETDDAYVVRARGGNERSELTIDKATGVLRAVAPLARGCGTLAYGPVPLGPREALRLAADPDAGTLAVRWGVLGSGCAEEAVRWDRTFSLPTGRRYDFRAGDISEDSARVSVVGTILLEARGYRPVILSLDAADGSLRYGYVGDTVIAAATPARLLAPVSLSDGGTAALLAGDARRAPRLYRVGDGGELAFAPVAPADTNGRFGRLFELSDGSLAVSTRGPGASGPRGLEAYATNGQRRFSVAYEGVLAGLPGVEIRVDEVRAAVNRAATGDIAVALRAFRGDTVGVAVVQTALTGETVGAQFVPVRVFGELQTVANRLYEDSDGALLFFGEGGSGMVAFRSLDRLVSATPIARWPTDRGPRLSPNPTSGRVRVTWGGTVGDRGPGGFAKDRGDGRGFDPSQGPRRLTVRNAAGQVVHQSSEASGGALELGGLPPGTYTVEVAGVGAAPLSVR